VAAGGPPCEYWKLRCLVAGFSVGACFLMYYCARRLGASVAGASLAFLLETFNMLHNVEGRLILLNSQLLFWLNATLFAGLCWFAAANEAARAGKWMSARERLGWVVLVGFLSGNAFSIKHTGLGTPAMLMLEGGLGLFFLVRPLPLLDLAGMVVVMFFTYAAYFGFHFWNFVYSHGQLRQETEFMSEEFQSLLIGAERYNPAARWTEGFWRTFYTFNIRMVVHSAAITQPHAWGTRPWEWIFDLRGVSYWGSTMGGGPDDKASIYLLGNPLINWGIVACLALLPVLAFLHQRTAWYRVGASEAVDFFRSGTPGQAPGAALMGWLYVAALGALTVRYYNDLGAFATAQYCAAGGAGALALLHLSPSLPAALAIPSRAKQLVTAGLYALAALAALGALGVYALGHVHGVEGEEHSGHSRLIGVAPALVGIVAASIQGWKGWAPPSAQQPPAAAAGAAAAAVGAPRSAAAAPAVQWAVAVAPVSWVVLGWLVNLVPYAAIHRTTFAYHYMPALVYGNLLIALLVDRLAGLWGAVAVAAATGATWLFYRPWIFGYGLTEEEHARRRWLDRWN
jgi:dolichyl-phosphate-mannose--protein O-mannosyl transferase